MSNVLSEIVSAITGAFTTLGSAVINLVKVGFIQLFTTYTESDGVYTVTGLSPFSYYCFILMGISLCLGIVYLLVNMARRSR